MHRALQIPEILLNIFSHLFSPPSYCGPLWPRLGHNHDMAALARTCRAFKEPALDLLWSVLGNMSPIARCLPHACNQVSRSYERRKFCRTLTREELDILRSYTRRVRSIIKFDEGFDWNSVGPLREDIIQEPLFPNLRFLSCRLFDEAVSSPPHQYIPTLSAITVDAMDGPRLARDCLKPFSDLYPNLKKIIVRLDFEESHSEDDSPRGAFTWPWKDLQSLSCPRYELDVDDLKQLSCLSALTKLAFSPSDTSFIDMANLSVPLVFPNLQDLRFIRSSASLESFSRLLSKMELPVITHLLVDGRQFSSESVGPFLSTVQNASINHSIEYLALCHDYGTFPTRSWHLKPVLTSDDLRLAVTFSNLRHLYLQVASHVALADDGLLELVSAWPMLEYLSINEELGWDQPEMGITPDGLVQLLQTCPLLNEIALAIDTRSYTAPRGALDRSPGASSGLDLPAIFRINVLNSTIEDESVLAMANWLAAIVLPYARFNFRAWQACSCLLYSDDERTAYKDRWEEVYRVANAILGRSEDDDNLSWRDGWPSAY